MNEYPGGLIADATNAITRTSSPALDAILGHSFHVLDRGFIRVIDYMGDDDAVLQAARVSYGTGTKSVSDDRSLTRYLLRHNHTTPFEMCELKLHVKLPVFVARQWVRHRTANINEYSARYSILDREFYIPSVEQLAKQSTTNKQGRDEVFSGAQAREIQDWLFNDSQAAYDGYMKYSTPTDEGGEYGLARELARMNLPTNIYTQWYWKVDLHNLLHFLKLRADSHAQWEIRQYAHAMCEIVKMWVPHAFEAFEDYRQQSVTFSKQELEVLREALSDAELATPAGSSARENAEFRSKLGKA